jgi:hypothetical protein
MFLNPRGGLSFVGGGETRLSLDLSTCPGGRTSAYGPARTVRKRTSLRGRQAGQGSGDEAEGYTSVARAEVYYRWRQKKQNWESWVGFTKACMLAHLEAGVLLLTRRSQALGLKSSRTPTRRSGCPWAMRCISTFGRYRRLFSVFLRLGSFINQITNLKSSPARLARPVSCLHWINDPPTCFLLKINMAVGKKRDSSGCGAPSGGGSRAKTKVGLREVTWHLASEDIRHWVRGGG